jgi:hypothetical protein
MSTKDTKGKEKVSSPHLLFKPHLNIPIALSSDPHLRILVFREFLVQEADQELVSIIGSGNITNIDVIIRVLGVRKSNSALEEIFGLESMGSKDRITYPAGDSK